MSRRSSRTARAPAGDELLSPSTIRAKAGPSQSTTTTSRSNSGSLHETRTAEGSANASGAAGKGSNKRGRSSRSASLNSTAQRPPEDGDTAVGGHDASPAETNMMHGDDDELDILGLEPANAQKSVKLSPNAARTGEDAVTGTALDSAAPPTASSASAVRPTRRNVITLKVRPTAENAATSHSPATSYSAAKYSPPKKSNPLGSPDSNDEDGIANVASASSAEPPGSSAPSVATRRSSIKQKTSNAEQIMKEEKSSRAHLAAHETRATAASSGSPTDSTTMSHETATGQAAPAPYANSATDARSLNPASSARLSESASHLLAGPSVQPPEERLVEPRAAASLPTQSLDVQTHAAEVEGTAAQRAEHAEPGQRTASDSTSLTDARETLTAEMLPSHVPPSRAPETVTRLQEDVVMSDAAVTEQGTAPTQGLLASSGSDVAPHQSTTFSTTQSEPVRQSEPDRMPSAAAPSVIPTSADEAPRRPAVASPRSEQSITSGLDAKTAPSAALRADSVNRRLTSAEMQNQVDGNAASSTADTKTGPGAADALTMSNESTFEASGMAGQRHGGDSAAATAPPEASSSTTWQTDFEQSTPTLNAPIQASDQARGEAYNMVRAAAETADDHKIALAMQEDEKRGSRTLRTRPAPGHVQTAPTSPPAAKVSASRAKTSKSRPQRKKGKAETMNDTFSKPAVVPADPEPDPNDDVTMRDCVSSPRLARPQDEPLHRSHGSAQAKSEQAKDAGESASSSNATREERDVAGGPQTKPTALSAGKAKNSSNRLTTLASFKRSSGLGPGGSNGTPGQSSAVTPDMTSIAASSGKDRTLTAGDSTPSRPQHSRAPQTSLPQTQLPPGQQDLVNGLLYGDGKSTPSSSLRPRSSVPVNGTDDNHASSQSTTPAVAAVHRNELCYDDPDKLHERRATEQQKLADAANNHRVDLLDQATEISILEDDFRKSVRERVTADLRRVKKESEEAPRRQLPRFSTFGSVFSHFPRGALSRQAVLSDKQSLPIRDELFECKT